MSQFASDHFFGNLTGHKITALQNEITKKRLMANRYVSNCLAFPPRTC